MAKKICIYLLAVLFIGSVAGVHATPIKHFKKSEKKSHLYSKKKIKSVKKSDKKSHLYSKTKKLKKSEPLKIDKNDKHRASFLKLIKEVESKITKGKNKDWKIDKIAKIVGKTKFVKGQFKRGNDNSGMHAPEPATILLLGTGLIGLAGWRRKKLKR